MTLSQDSEKRLGPGDEFPPTRPNLMLIVVAVAVVLAGVAALNWTTVTAEARQIEHALGL